MTKIFAFLDLISLFSYADGKRTFELFRRSAQATKKQGFAWLLISPAPPCKTISICARRELHHLIARPNRPKKVRYEGARGRDLMSLFCVFAVGCSRSGAYDR
jgi:hypothetical protein